MERDMTVGTPYKIILNFTLPIVIGNIFSKVLFIAVSGIVSMSLGDETALAGGILGGYLVTFG